MRPVVSGSNQDTDVGAALRGRPSSRVDSAACAQTSQSPRLARNVFRARLAGFLLAGIAAAAGSQAIGGSFDYGARAGPTSPAQSGASQGEKPAEQVYKNIQVFKGLPASQLDGAMAFMAASLGVACDHCHVAPWESDENPAKGSARRMIEMMRGINKQNYAAAAVVTCYTCHRGKPDPPSSPDANDPAWQQAGDEKLDTRKPDSLPSIETIVAKYYEALGGRSAVNNLKTMVLTGSQTTTDRMDPPVTIHIDITHNGSSQLLIATVSPQEPNSYLIIDSGGWITARGIRRQLTAEQVARIKRDLNFADFLRLTERFPNLRVLGKEKFRAADVYSVGAATPEGSREKLYFDVATGLLLRRVVMLKTVLGSIPEITEFEDYRVIDGIKLPFRINWSRPPFSKTRAFTNIKLNVAVDESSFRAPEKETRKPT